MVVPGTGTASSPEPATALSLRVNLDAAISSRARENWKVLACFFPKDGVSLVAMSLP